MERVTTTRTVRINIEMNVKFCNHSSIFLDFGEYIDFCASYAYLHEKRRIVQVAVGVNDNPSVVD